MIWHVHKHLEILHDNHHMLGLRGSISIVVLLWSIFFTAASADSLPATLERIRGSVVAIGTVTPVLHASAKKPNAKFVGTGFVIGNGRQVITNYHVIPSKIDDKHNESLAVFSGRGQLALPRKAKVIRLDKDHDLALLEIDGPKMPVIQLENGNAVKEGQDVAFTGFPLGMALGMYPVTHKTIISAITPVVIPANSSRKLTAAQIKRLKTPYEVFQLDSIAYPGNSGSPVYRIDTGKVIGIVNSVFVKGTKESMLKTPSGISYAIPVRYIHKILDGS
ncbi:MAG: serine protease [Sedimenticola sp.]